MMDRQGFVLGIAAKRFRDDLNNYLTSHIPLAHAKKSGLDAISKTLQPDTRPERWTALNVCLIVQTDGVRSLTNSGLGWPR